MSEPIVEVRDYTINADDFPAYCAWARDLAEPWLRENLDLVGFWLDSGDEAQVTGVDPHVSKHGQANVHWILRWESREAREARWQTWTQEPGWQAIWAQHPNPAAYIQMNVRFMSTVGR